MRARKSILLALLILGAIAALAALRPPQPASPFARVVTADGVQFSILIQPQPTLTTCQSALSLVEQRICQLSPGCVFKEQACLVSLGSEIRKIAGAEPLNQPSLRFTGGDIVFESADTAAMLAACRALESQKAGKCFAANTNREPHVSGDRKDSFFQVQIDWDKAWRLLTTAFVISLAMSVLIMITQRWHGRFSFDAPTGLQKFHDKPVPRIGGLALMMGLSIAVIFMPNMGIGFHAGLALPTLFAASVAFGFGLLEDLSGRVGVIARLLATMASAVLAWWFMGVSISAVEIPAVDTLLAISFISVAFTALAVGGLANAINLIDGFHGLAAGVTAILFAVLAWIARDVGDTKLMLFCLLVIAASLGYLLLNYPWGKIFLGDGGSYLLGFLLGWVAVLLPARNPTVSPWASLLVCAYPVAETLFSIYRRAKLKVDIASPDRAHLHSLFKLAVIRPAFPGLDASWRNALVAPPLWLLAVLPGVFAAVFYDNTIAVMIGFLVFCAAYWAIYRRLAARALGQS